MIKRLVDILASSVGLLALLPVLALIAFLVWLHDFGPPFYRAYRVGKGERKFRMLKFRTMVVDADRTGVTSTAGDDPRITPIGRLIRRFKLDELAQLYNVLLGDMSLVGPRPNVPSGTAVYTNQERHLLTVKPGITDFASIVFADESEILAGSSDPDLDYEQLIRPWKSSLGLFYVKHQSLQLDLRLLCLTFLSLVSRPRALAAVSELLGRLGAPEDLVEVSLRSRALVPVAPPGADEFVTLHIGQTTWTV